MACAVDGSILFVEKNGGNSRILRIARPGTTTVAQTEGTIDFLAARPRYSQVLYRENGALWLVNLDGSGKSQMQLEPGRTGELTWTPSGKTLLYLHIPDDRKQLITLRESDPSLKADRELARTSQFESVAPNGDSSVFVGASRSRASAYVLILL